MAHENVQRNTECKSESHGQHLCYFVSQGIHLTEPQNYEAMVRDPKYKCKHCGRVAKNDGNLCGPVSLSV
jgi:hypothetical protein